MSLVKAAAWVWEWLGVGGIKLLPAPFAIPNHLLSVLNEHRRPRASKAVYALHVTGRSQGTMGCNKP